MKIELVGEKNEIIDINENTSLFSLLKKTYKYDYNKYLAVKVNNKLQELECAQFKENDKIKFIDINKIYRYYRWRWT